MELGIDDVAGPNLVADSVSATALVQGAVISNKLADATVVDYKEH